MITTGRLVCLPPHSSLCNEGIMLVTAAIATPLIALSGTSTMSDLTEGWSVGNHTIFTT